MLMLVLFFTGLSNVSVIITAEILTVIHFSVFFYHQGQLFVMEYYCLYERIFFLYFSCIVAIVHCCLLLI